MSYVSIPLAVLESPDYLALSVADRQFLVDLYVLFNDCPRFTLDMTRPQDYRQPAGATIARKIRRLLDAGLLYVDNYRKLKFGYQRVFSLTHPTLQLKEAIWQQ